MTEHQPLLGRLASRWFHEYIVTEAFSLLLDDRTARAAFLDVVGQTAGVDLSAVSAFERERPIADGQLDLQGVDPQGRPRLIIEAKFGHTMSHEQMRKYLTHQVAALTGTGRTDPVEGVLLLLVPQPRLADAAAIMTHLASSQTEPTGGAPRVVPVSLSWEHCLNTVMAAVAPEDAGPVSLAADTAQLRALCTRLSAESAPLTDLPEIEQEAHLRHIVLDLLKDRVPRVAMRLAKDQDHRVFRYYAMAGENGSVYSIGLSSVYRTKEDDTDVWLRFNKTTGDFAEIQKRIHRSALFEKSRAYRGHIWFPLEVDPALPGPELVDRLAEQVAVIVAAASRPPSPNSQVPVVDPPDGSEEEPDGP